ncbi:MAG: hypothetical protein QM767_15335 [Anaeromyxobacter sp.]
MRNTVTFHHPAPLVFVSEEDGVLSIAGAGWFLELLRTISGLDLDHEVTQEDWGVVARASRAGCRFWIGLSGLGQHESMAHVHHHSLAWLQRLSPGGRAALAALVGEVDRALRVAKATDVRWFEESNRNHRAPAESPT